MNMFEWEHDPKDLPDPFQTEYQRLFGGLLRNSTNYGDQYCECPECGGIAEAMFVDVGVGLYIDSNYVCDCGWESDADGMMNVESYDDYGRYSSCQ